MGKQERKIRASKEEWLRAGKREFSGEDEDEETAQGLARRFTGPALLRTYQSMERARRVLGRAIYYAQEIDAQKERE